MKSINLLLMLLLATQVMAGPNEKESDALGLTAEQKQQMHEVKQRQHERLLVAREEIKAQSKAEMAEFLTADQLAQVEDMQKHRQEHRQLRKQHNKVKRKSRRLPQDGG